MNEFTGALSSYRYYIQIRQEPPDKNQILQTTLKFGRKE